MLNLKSASEELTENVYKALEAAYPGILPDDVAVQVVRTGDPRHGDYQCNAAMGLARHLKTSPRSIATTICDKLAEMSLPAEIEIAGPGFINFTLKGDWLAERLNALDAAERRGMPAYGDGKTIVIDYSSPNVAKPMHIGHIRSTVIGNALDRLHRYSGYRVVADNHLGDWGTQFGLILMGYKHYLDADALEAHPVEELERLYVKSYGQAKEDEAWMGAARDELVKLQRGDEENLALWRQFVELSLSEFHKIYDRLDVHFELERGESFYNDTLPGVLDRLREKDLLVESEGAQVVDLEEEKLGVCIVQKSDGGFNYATTDLATVISRVEEFAPEKILYVTDERQQRHFNQFFTVIDKLGIEVKLEHVWFGLMRLPDATFSTREGNVIKLEALLDEAERRALAMVQHSSPDMPEAQQAEVARAVGIGALKYADLSQNPQSLVTFTWEKAMALDGNSAPYLQYAHARIRSVLDRFAEQFPDESASDAALPLDEPLERELVLKLVQFSEAVWSATRNLRPNFMADYLFELAQTYSTYHQSIPFLKAEPSVRPSRMRLIGMVADTLKEGLGLLGIVAPERI